MRYNLQYPCRPLAGHERPPGRALMNAYNNTFYAIDPSDDVINVTKMQIAEGDYFKFGTPTDPVRIWLMKITSLKYIEQLLWGGRAGGAKMDRQTEAHPEYV